jgi:hypothetical protein
LCRPEARPHRHADTDIGTPALPPLKAAGGQAKPLEWPVFMLAPELLSDWCHSPTPFSTAVKRKLGKSFTAIHRRLRRRVAGVPACLSAACLRPARRQVSAQAGSRLLPLAIPSGFLPFVAPKAGNMPALRARPGVAAREP